MSQTTAPRVITDYRIVPETGDGVCVVGTMNGKPWRTTTVARFHAADRLVETRSGSVYALREPHASIWGMQLQMKRPALAAKLAAFF